MRLNAQCPPAKECSLTKEMRIEAGSMEDWRRLAGFHYRSHRVAGPRKVFRLMRGDELCGVIVYAYPPPTCFGRSLVLPKMTPRELNRALSTISRVVIHPKYRSIGLGARLIRETLPLAVTPYVETVAVMARYNPFFERAGMRKVAEQPPPKEALKIADLLSSLGFNVRLLCSGRYVLENLRSLSPEQIDAVREAFMKYAHPRFMKSFSAKMPFGSKEAYAEQVMKISTLSRSVRKPQRSSNYELTLTIPRRCLPNRLHSRQIFSTQASRTKADRLGLPCKLSGAVSNQSDPQFFAKVNKI